MAKLLGNMVVYELKDFLDSSFVPNILDYDLFDLKSDDVGYWVFWRGNLSKKGFRFSTEDLYSERYCLPFRVNHCIVRFEESFTECDPFCLGNKYMSFPSFRIYRVTVEDCSRKLQSPWLFKKTDLIDAANVFLDVFVSNLKKFNYNVILRYKQKTINDLSNAAALSLKDEQEELSRIVSLVKSLLVFKFGEDDDSFDQSVVQFNSIKSEVEKFVNNHSGMESLLVVLRDKISESSWSPKMERERQQRLLEHEPYDWEEAMHEFRKHLGRFGG